MDAALEEPQATPAPARSLLLRVLRAAVAGLVVVAGSVAIYYFAAIEETALAAEVRKPAPLPAEIDARMTPDRSLPMEVELDAETTIDGHRVLPGRMQVKRKDGEQHEARFWFYFGDGVQGKAPTIIVTPILASAENRIAKTVADDLATHGYHAVIVDRTWKVGEVALPTLEAVETTMRDMVADRRRVIDWLLTRDEVDPERLGAYGVSLGGITTVCLIAAEPRIKASVVVMAGGDLSAVICRSVEKECVALARDNDVPAGATPEELAAFESKARKIIRTEPYSLAPHVDPGELILVTTRRDTSVPSFLQQRLREALGNPRTISLPTGHYSAAFYLPIIKGEARAFLAEHL